VEKVMNNIRDKKNNTNLSDIINELVELKIELRCSQFGELLGRDLENLEKKIEEREKKIPEMLANEVRLFFSLPRIFAMIGFFFFAIIASTWFIASVITSTTSDIAQYKKDINSNTAARKALTTRLNSLEVDKAGIHNRHDTEIGHIKDQINGISKRIDNIRSGRK
jgi:hypothetical protein